MTKVKHIRPIYGTARRPEAIIEAARLFSNQWRRRQNQLN